MNHTLGKLALLSLLTTAALPTSAFASAATVFQHCGFSGYNINLEVGNYDLKRLEKMGMKNDDLSSIKVSSGFKVTLHQHHHFQGRKIVRKKNDSCFINEKFNDTISSISVKRIAPNKHKKATVYQHCKFAGYKARLAPGRYTMAQLKKKGVKNDDLSSIKVPKGYEIVLFEHDNFSGRKLRLKNNDSCLIDNSFNDTISSIIFRKKK